jgi:phosphatidylinositol-3-phosphatase
MLMRVVIVGLCAIAMISMAFALEGSVPKGVPHLDHVFLVMMENYG